MQRVLFVVVVIAPSARPPEGRRANFTRQGARASRSDAYALAEDVNE
jgi:hypothetical protein